MVKMRHSRGKVESCCTMMKMGQTRRPSAGTRRVTPVQFTPPSDYRLDVELIPAAELRSRVARVQDRGIERIDFTCVIHVTNGSYVHTVDFESVRCRPGSCLIIHPGQVHEFGHDPDWDGWMLLFRSESLPPSETVDQAYELPPLIETRGDTRAAITETFERMARDAASSQRQDTNRLLLGQVAVLLTRLHLAHAAFAARRTVEPLALERYRSFRAAVDREFRNWHHVGDYAAHLGWSVKTLTRTTREVVDLAPKRIIVDRIVLEAKRLLAHTSQTVATISRHLGFDEPTNFVKFFRRETGMTPGVFQTTMQRRQPKPPPDHEVEHDRHVQGE